ncbi:MAG: hypothetical protein PVJ28_02860 [Acidimicrobiia bacterium]|jgi:hypothetical protein
MRAGEPTSRVRKAIPWLWLAASLAWAIVIIVTDHLAWPLALWIATTVGPLTYLSRQRDQSGPQGSTTKGTRQ